MDRDLYNYAVSFVGIPYKYGGNNPLEGFDCSGLVLEILKAAGIFPNRYDATSQMIHDYMKKEAKVLLEPLAGAVVTFGADEENISHVAFCLNHAMILEAGGGNSSTKTLEDAKKQNAFVKIRPIVYRKNLRGIFLPRY